MFEGEGYEGVATAVMTAAVQRRKVPLILNVPNRGAIGGLRDDDVVEVTCLVDEHGAHPIAQGRMPEAALTLVAQVKLYERLTVIAAVEGSYDAALGALLAHPLVALVPGGEGHPRRVRRGPAGPASNAHVAERTSVPGTSSGTRASKPASTDRKVGHMLRRITVATAFALGLTLVATPALACGGLVNPNGTVSLVRTTTLAAYHNGVEHYVTSFEFAGGTGEFGSIIPLPGIPSKVIRGGDWTLQRLVQETQPEREALAFAEDAAAAAPAAAQVI